jgi:hypothetical protein
MYSDRNHNSQALRRSSIAKRELMIAEGKYLIEIVMLGIKIIKQVCKEGTTDYYYRDYRRDYI